MRKSFVLVFMVMVTFTALMGWKNNIKEEKKQNDSISEIQKLVNDYAVVKLTTDLSTLTAKEKQMLPLLIEAADIMNDIYWKESFGDKEELLKSIEDEATKKLVLINYGPWNRLDGEKPFVDKYDVKPAGAKFYPIDMTKDEFDKLKDANKTSQYSLIKRKEDGSLYVVSYHEAFKKQIKKAARLVKQAAELAEDAGLKKYLTLRAKALLTDDYFESDMAWMDMKTNTIDFIIGPIENYEDGLYGYKAAHEAFVLVKDKVWSERLAKYVSMLPELQKGLPVDAKYKAEVPSSNSDLGVYDALFYAGDCNAGSKTIAINLPNDEKVQLAKGSRRLQLKNSMKAKFDKILVPISDMLIEESQRKNINFDAFFENTMFHEVAHGIGIKNTINKKGSVREALKEQYSGIEEAKADILGLYLVTKLYEKGELGKKDLMDNYVTFMASIFRSIRFGTSSAHGNANVLKFNYFNENGAFTRDDKTGTYKVDFQKMQDAMNKLTEMILVLQGNGDYEGVKSLMEEKAKVKQQLRNDLDKLSTSNIPVDIVFEQGKSVLGL